MSRTITQSNRNPIVAVTTTKNQFKPKQSQFRRVSKRKKKLKNPNLSFRLEAFSASDQTSGPASIADISPTKTNEGLITLMNQDDDDRGNNGEDDGSYNGFGGTRRPADREDVSNFYR